MRTRTLIIIVLIVVAVTPAALGTYARQRLQQELIAAGVPPSRIITAAGWRQSRVLFPLPKHPELEMDLVLLHGPYLGTKQGWGWLGSSGQLLYLQQEAARLSAKLSFGFWLLISAEAEPGLQETLHAWHWQGLNIELQGHPARMQWRGSIIAAELGQSFSASSGGSASTWQLQQGQIDWAWNQDVHPNLGLWFKGQGFQLDIDGATTPLSVGQLSLNSDWLEQGSSGALRQQWQLEDIQATGSTVERLHGAWQAAPLERSVVRQIPEFIASAQASGQALPATSWLLQLAPLLALRPRLEIDSLGLSHQGQAILLSGEIQARPGGVAIRTQGGGPESLYLRLLQLLQFSHTDNAAISPAQSAAQALQQIRRQGWLQAQGQGSERELRADIVINY